MTNLQKPMAGLAGLLGLAFVAFFRWTVVHCFAGGVDEGGAAAAAYDLVVRPDAGGGDGGGGGGGAWAPVGLGPKGFWGGCWSALPPGRGRLQLVAGWRGILHGDLPLLGAGVVGAGAAAFFRSASSSSSCCLFF